MRKSGQCLAQYWILNIEFCYGAKFSVGGSRHLARKNENLNNVELSISMIVELAKPEEFVPANGTDCGLSLFGDTTSSGRHDPATTPKNILHDLQFLGSQFSAPAETHIMSPFTKAEAKERSACQYHSQIFQRLVSVDVVKQDRDILERYHVESPGR